MKHRSEDTMAAVVVVVVVVQVETGDPSHERRIIVSVRRSESLSNLPAETLRLISRCRSARTKSAANTETPIIYSWSTAHKSHAIARSASAFVPCRGVLASAPVIHHADA